MKDLNQKNKIILKQENIYSLSQELHPSFCSCNACGNSKDTNFPNEENLYSSSKNRKIWAAVKKLKMAKIGQTGEVGFLPVKYLNMK